MKLTFLERLSAKIFTDDVANSENTDNNRIVSFWKNTFSSLGYQVGKTPVNFIIIPILMSLIGFTGFQQINIVEDSGSLFRPIDGENTVTEIKIRNLFLPNSSEFDPSRITDDKHLAKVYITAKDNGTLLRKDIFEEISYVRDLILNITVEWDGQPYTYKNICAKWQGECFANTVYDLKEIIPELENGKEFLSYPVNLYPFIPPMVLGGVNVNKTNGITKSFKALLALYFLEKDDDNEKERATLWEKQLQDTLHAKKFDLIKVDYFTTQSFPEELQKVQHSSEFYVKVAIIILLIFTLIAASSMDCVRSKVLMGIIAIFTTIFAVGSSFGFLMYAGYPFVPMILTAIFVILGIALDNMSHMLCSWRNTKIQDSVPTRMSIVYSLVAPSMTVKLLVTNFVVIVASTSSFPGLHLFCVYLGFANLFVYVWFLSLYGGLLALYGYQEKGQRHNLISCIAVSAKSESIENQDNWLRKVFCTGGIRKTDPWNMSDNEECLLTKFFKSPFTAALSGCKLQVTIVFFYALYIAASSYGCINLNDGLDLKHLAMDESNLQSFFHTEKQYFTNFSHRIQVLIEGNLTYSSKSTLKEFVKLNRQLYKLPKVGSALFSENWYLGFQKYLRRKRDLKKQITNETSYIQILKKHYFEADLKERLDIHLNQNGSRVEASRIIIQMVDIEKFEEEKEFLRTLRRMFDDSPFNISFYHPTFILHDQVAEVNKIMRNVAPTLIFGAAIVTLIFTFSLWAFILTGASVVSIEVGVIGCMSLLGIELDVFSVVNLIMCAGILVLPIVNFVYGLKTSLKSSIREKLDDCFGTFGAGMFKSFTLISVGAIMFAFIPCYIQRCYFVVLILTCCFSALHSFFFLPTLMLIVGRIVCRRENFTLGTTPQASFRQNSLHSHDDVIRRNCDKTEIMV